MRLSFVVPTYNRAHRVAATVASVLRQPYPDVELVLVDDGSTDELDAALRPFAGEPRLRLVRFGSNRGQNVARNEGFIAASGEVVTILDSDDEDAGADLSPVMALFRERPRLAGVFTATISKTAGRAMGRLDRAGVEFGFEGFLGDPYAGEYQLFLRKSAMPERVFAEGLGIRRSCTLLTWLELGETRRFVIHPLPTRLYDDGGADRLGAIDNILRDAGELLTCNEAILGRFGAAIRRARPAAWNELTLNCAYYDLLAHGRRAALGRFLSVNPLAGAGGRWLAAALSLTLGPGATRALRRAVGRLRSA